jgi:integrator complex subunit 11
VQRNLFDFRNIKPFERHQIDAPGPMVLFATPGMLHSGLSLDVFKKWAGSELNLVVIPGYCVVGTVGNKLLTGRTHTVEIDKKTTLDVKCKVANLSFSAHADAKGSCA